MVGEADDSRRELEVCRVQLRLQREAIEETQDRLDQWLSDRTAELEAANRSLKAEIRVRSAIEMRLRHNRERLRSLASQLEDVEERERRRIAANLHDLIGQTLASANMKLGLLAHGAADETERAELEDVRRLNQRMIDETRNIITDLSPPVVEEQDMRTAGRWLVDHFDDNHGLAIDFEDELEADDLPYPLKHFLFRSLRELLFNVLKHAHTTDVRVRLGSTSSRAELEVVDDGAGFDAELLDSSAGFGLFSLRERVQALGGSVEIDTCPGHGTRVALILPR